jgi:hypothetical protein
MREAYWSHFQSESPISSPLLFGHVASIGAQAAQEATRQPYLAVMDGGNDVHVCGGLSVPLSSLALAATPRLDKANADKASAGSSHMATMATCRDYGPLRN